MNLGLRFPASEARKLRHIADQLRQEPNRNEDTSLFDKAADSVELNEPLIVVCQHPREAERIAHGFTRWGIERPAIDHLNG